MAVCFCNWTFVMSLSVILLVWGFYGIKLSPLESMSDSVLVRWYEDKLTTLSCLIITVYTLLSGFFLGLFVPPG